MAGGSQVEMHVDDPEIARREQARDDDEQALLFERLIAACRAVARERTIDRCATELDRIWGDRGRPVSAAVLRAALSGTERNYFRVEWAIWFARHSDVVADLILEIGGRGKPKKTPEEELRDLKELLRRELGPTGDKLVRKAAAR